MIWKILKTFLHPITVKKVVVVGSNYKSTIDALGITFDDEYLAGTPPSWTRELVRLRQQFPMKTLQHGYLMPEEEERLKQLMQEPLVQPD